MQCPIHHVEFREVPAGVSKTTGKPYNAFMACPERGCREKPPKPEWAPEAVRQQYAPTTVVKEDKPDWDKIAEGKVRHGVICAMLENGRTYEEISTTYQKYVELIIQEQPF